MENTKQFNEDFKCCWNCKYWRLVSRCTLKNKKRYYSSFVKNGNY